MTRILFIIPAFRHGGTNKSLYNVISFLKEKFDISIFALSHQGPYKNIFAKETDILKENNQLRMIFRDYGSIDLDKEGYIPTVIKIYKKVYRKLYRILIGKSGYEKILNQAAKELETLNYDVVIAMQEGDATGFASRIKGNKVAWVRCDYDEYYQIMNKDEGSIYSKFNSIICVSDYTRKTFLNHYPFLEQRCYGIHNMIDYDKIKYMSLSEVEYDKKFQTNNFTMISIGRLSKVKQFDIIPSISSELLKRGLLFNWYIIGEGEERSRINEQIKKYNVEDRVILLGEKNNPYPYIKNSDLVVVTSLSEACPNVINEAKILHVPVVTTNFGSAKEFIQDGFNGYISTKEDIVDVIDNMIRKNYDYQKIKTNISSFQYSNEKIIDKIVKIIKGV